MINYFEMQLFILAMKGCFSYFNKWNMHPFNMKVVTKEVEATTANSKPALDHSLVFAGKFCRIWLNIAQYHYNNMSNRLIVGK